MITLLKNILRIEGSAGYELDIDSGGRMLVSTETPGAITLELAYDATFEITENNYFYTGVAYTIPTGYKFVVTSVTSLSLDNRVTVKCNQSVSFGTYDPFNEIYVKDDTISAPDFMAGIDLKVTSDMGNDDDILFTVTYTNQDGLSGRTATVGGIKIKKQVTAGFKIPMFLQSGDFGVRSVEAIVGDVVNTGAIEVQGIKNFFYQRLKEADTHYSFTVPRESIIIPAGDDLNIDIGSNGAATVRRIVRLNGYLVPE